MKTIKQLIAFTLALALFTCQIHGEVANCEKPICCDNNAPPCCNNNTECCDAYCESGSCSYLSALLPIGALAIAAVIIATTDHHNHHSSSSSRSSSSSSIHSHSSSSPAFSSF